MIALDLCCGIGGWTEGALAAGFDVVGLDIYRHPKYPAEYMQCDLLDDATVRRLIVRFRAVSLVLASPPCDEFARFDKPACWFPQGRPEPSLDLVWRCREIAYELNAPLILENVRGAQRFIGTAIHHFGPFYLWGDGVPPLLSPCDRRIARFKQSGWNPALRARIPFDLAYQVADFHANRISSGEPYRVHGQWSGYTHETRVMRAQARRKAAVHV